MRFILLLLVALAATVTWQTRVVAGQVNDDAAVAATDDTKQPPKDTRSQEPECE